MKEFHISDVLTVTTGRLVSSRHMDGIYEILNFLTGDNLFTHQLPRAMRECEPWLKTQFPYLFPSNPAIQKAIDGLDALLAIDGDDREAIARTLKSWVDGIRSSAKFPDVIPEMLPVYEMGADMHTHIDPVEEAKAMAGDKKVIALEVGEPEAQ
jgi:hypothetical protein